MAFKLLAEGVFLCVREYFLLQICECAKLVEQIVFNADVVLFKEK